jgi:hypothetical protein
VADIYNKLASSGIIPDGLKCTIVNPLFKKGDKSQLSDYRI